MKKLFVLTVVLVSIISFPNFTHAQVDREFLLARITELQAQLQILVAKLAVMQASKSGSSEENSITENTVAIEVEEVRSQQNGSNGSYVMGISVTPSGSNVYIPKTSSDSAIKGLVGFNYIISGDKFSGKQSSKISCDPTHTIDEVEYCKVKVGETRKIYVSVGLVPVYVGNYGIVFDKIKYLIDGKYKIYDLPSEAESSLIYIE